VALLNLPAKAAAARRLLCCDLGGAPRPYRASLGGGVRAEAIAGRSARLGERERELLPWLLVSLVRLPAVATRALATTASSATASATFAPSAAAFAPLLLPVASTAAASTAATTAAATSSSASCRCRRTLRPRTSFCTARHGEVCTDTLATGSLKESLPSTPDQIERSFPAVP